MVSHRGDFGDNIQGESRSNDLISQVKWRDRAGLRTQSGAQDTSQSNEILAPFCAELTNANGKITHGDESWVLSVSR